MPGQVSTWKQIALSAVLLAAAGAAWHKQEGLAAYLGLGDRAERTSVTRESGVPVIVAPVLLAEDALTVEAVGSGLAQRSVTLMVETAGKVVEMPLRPGGRYGAGEVLLRLDDAQQRLAVALAETRLAEAERVRERMRQLQDSGTAARARLDETRTAAEIARIELDAAREALDDRVLRAPFDGVAGLPDVEVGDWVDTGVEIASFDDRSVILVGFDLPEALIGRIHPGMSVTATTPAVPGQRFEGGISAIDSRIAVDSRTARIRVAIPNPGDRLRPGASFTVRLQLPGDRYPVVPELALQFAHGTLYVWRIDGETVERVEVRLVRRRGGEVLLDGPLDEADLVVIEGTQRLAPGQRVAIVKTAGGGST